MRLFTNILLTVMLLIGWSGCQAETPKQIKKIYIAPDLGTYLFAISMWDADTTFPVFMDKDDRYTQKFADAYADGGNIEYVEMPKYKAGRISEALAYKTLYAAWGPETLDDLKKKKIGRDEIKQRLAELDHTPEGIVITNVKDAEFAGGIALAAGHKQIMDFYSTKHKLRREIDYAKIHITVDQKETIRNDLISLIESWGYQYIDHTGINYITLAMDIAHAYKRDKDYLSIDDAINRTSIEGTQKTLRLNDRTRKYYDCFAYVGRLLEVTPYASVYQGMCPLFLPIKSVYFASGWDGLIIDNCKKAAEIFKSKIAATVSGADIKSWKKHMKDKGEFSFVWVNAKGTPYVWNGKKVDDLVDSVPVVVYFAHSFSAKNPLLKDTIAGRWLLNGAYIYYGSIDEPYASAFNIPSNVANSIVYRKDPFGKAFQFKMTLPGPMSKPWKLIYIGDPLYRPRYHKEANIANGLRK
jgi:hypothetical protein